MQDFTTASRGRAISRTFAHVPQIDMPRSILDRSHRHTMTMDSGYLNPIYCDEILPGDTVKIDTTSFIRLLTPLTPIMDNMYLETFFFFVPNRLVWDDWQHFMGEKDNPSDTTTYVTPICTSPPGGYAFGSLQDHMGIPPAVGSLDHLALPFRGVNLIWNEWFRDQDLQDSLPVPKDAGPDATPDTTYQLVRRGKRHDYFTSARPFAQKGNPVSIPLGGSAPLVGIIAAQATLDPQPTFKQVGQAGSGGGLQSAFGPPNNVTHPSATQSASNLEWVNPHLETDLSSGTADLSGVPAVDINMLRQSLALQTLYERDARGGTRYVELLRAHFGVVSPDQRLQRPEYLGGSSSRIAVHPVTNQLSIDTGGAPLGDLAAFVTGGDTGRTFTQSFTEHGFIIGFASVRADLTYQRGLHKMWTRRDREEYYFPDLAHLGEQEILSREIYCTGAAADDDVFGYQERFGEYRYAQSMITGKFRSNDPQSLDSWHLSQDFGFVRPTLGSSFIEDNPPIKRTIVVQDEPEFKLDLWFDVNHVRPMPTYGIPRLGARF